MGQVFIPSQSIWKQKYFFLHGVYIIFTSTQLMEVGVNGQVDPAPRPVEKKGSNKGPVPAPNHLLVLDLRVKWLVVKPKYARLVR